ncbi:MAG: peptide ABC transporter substrate-binding protein [Phycisphaerales bacterium]|nr:peptide ABC transporter substrate-binding protein [Phycisphaerales bacterium]
MLKLLAPLVLVALAILAAALADPTPPRADFVFINRGDVTTLDLAKISWQQDLRVARIVHEGLVRNDVFTHDFDLRPAVAQSWDISPDGLTYTFRLRPGARWSNGDQVRASDFVYSWRRVMLPDSAADYTGFFFPIRGARDFFQWRSDQLGKFAAESASLAAPDRSARAADLWKQTLARFESTVGISAPDDLTLVVTLEQPVPYFLSTLSFPAMFPVYPPLVQRYERLDPATGMMQTDQGWTQPPACVNNGPFKVVRWNFKREMGLEKNPFYWDAASVAIDSISMPTIEDPAAQVLAYRTGTIMWITDVVARFTPEMYAQKLAYYADHRDRYDALKAQGLDQFEIDRRLPPDPRAALHVIPAFGTYFINFNCRAKLPDGRPNPLADRRIRRALTMAVDRRAIADQVRRLGEPVSPTLIPPGSIAGYPSPTGLERDVDQARRLLDEAGYPAGAGLPALDYLFTRDGGHDVIAQAVAKQWEQELGVRVNLVPKEIKAFREDLKSKNYMVSRGSWFGDYGDPTTFLELNRSGDGNNDRDYSSPQYDALLDEAARELDPARRMQVLSQAEAVMLADAPLLTLFQYNSVYVFDPHRFTGLSTHPRGEQDLARIDIFGDGKGSDQPMMMRH